MKKLLFLGILTTLISACATSPQARFHIVSQSISNGSPINRHCKIHYLNQDEKTIEGKQYTYQLENMLRNKGIYIVNEQSEDFDCIISVIHNTSYGKTQAVGYTYGQTGVSSSTSYTNARATAYSMGNSAYGFGNSTTYTNYTPTYGVTGSYTYDVPYMYNDFYINAIDANTKEEMWKVKVYYRGRVDDKWINIFTIFNCFMSKVLFINFDDEVVLTQEEINGILYYNKCNEQ